MPHDQSIAIVNQLRELRATVAGHTARFDRVEAPIGRIDEQLRDIHLLVARALGQGAASRLAPSSSSDVTREGGQACRVGLGRRPEARAEDSSESRLEERVADIEHRLATVEEKLGG